MVIRLFKMLMPSRERLFWISRVPAPLKSCPGGTPVAEDLVPDSTPGHLLLRWDAADKNLTPAPISLEWSERREGPWQAIAVDLPNAGQFSWNLPEKLPVEVFLRLRVRDLAGNETVAITPNSLAVDLHDLAGGVDEWSCDDIVERVEVVACAQPLLDHCGRKIDWRVAGYAVDNTGLVGLPLVAVACA